jgi:ATP-dependent DNA ligase
VKASGCSQRFCRRDLEGVVAKRKMGIYKDDGSAWLKIKNKKYSQAEGRLELLTRNDLVHSKREVLLPTLPIQP